ncbi:MAG TPA: hypothetical protein VGU69_18390 [Rhizomicrobium sp.]|nr:hypothetical protein [Rhizomicrobium sp.]
MKHLTAVALIAFMLARPASGADWLEPVSTDFDGLVDQKAMADVFKDVLARNVEARMIALESRRPGSAIGIRKVASGYELVGVELSAPLYAYAGFQMDEHGNLLPASKPDRPVRRDARAGYPQDFNGVPLSRCVASLDSTLATRLIAVWREMLYRTHYERPPPPQPGFETVIVTADGSDFIFSSSRENDYRPLEGETGTPLSGTAGELVAIGQLALDYCAGRSPAALTKLGRQTENLERELRKDD